MCAVLFIIIITEQEEAEAGLSRRTINHDDSWGALEINLEPLFHVQ